MARNIEVKFRDVDLDAIRDRAAALGASDRGMLEQLDTFFNCKTGRLKLRDFRTGAGELIAYDRANHTANRESDYQLAPTHDPESLLIALTRACGVSGRVAKRRNLWIWRNVRIHLDQVEQLGAFVELESVVGAEVDEPTARANLDAAIDGLGLVDAKRLAEAYVELMPGSGPRSAK